MDMKEEPDDEEMVDPEELFESVWFEAESVVATPDQANVSQNDVSNPLETKKKPTLKTRKCSLCDFTTVHGNSLKYHLLTHSDERPYPCEYCDFTSKYPPILKRHMNTQHADLVMSNVEPELFTCKKCDYKTSIKQNLKSHIRKHKKDKQFKCSECSYETAYKHSYVKHKKIHQSEEYKCDKCPFVTRFYGHITRHMEQIHNEIIQESKHICEFCQTTSKEKWKLRRHKERSIMNQAMKCVICDFETIYKCQMRKHKMLHVDEDGDCTFVLAAAMAATNNVNKGNEGNAQNDTQNPEKETEKEVNEYIQNQQKKQSHTEQTTTYKCDQCYFITSYQGHMVRHLQNIHNEVIKTSYVCEFCMTSSVDAAKLKQHKERSHVKGGLTCNQCDFKTSYKCELKRHNTLQHTANSKTADVKEVNNVAAIEKPKIPVQMDPRINARTSVIVDKGVLSCAKCPWKTLYEVDICKHLMEIHNICRYCNHCFSDKWSVNAHILKSKTDTVVKCTYCDFGSYFKCETRTHMDSHFTELCEPKDTSANFDIRSLLTYPYDGNIVKPPHYQKPFNPVPPKDQTTQYYANTVNSGPSSSQNSYLEENSETTIGQSKFGKFLIDQNCVDWRSIQVIESNDSINRYKCPLCDFPSKFKACVQRHFQRHHTGEQNRPYRCVNCNFSTKTKDAIALHNKRNPPGDTVKCKICDYTTQYKCAFVVHQKQHYTQKCSICNANYKHRHELVKHIATKHLGKGLKCFYCDYVSLRKDSMDSHILLHTGEKPFKCGMCSFGTVRKSLLDTHLRERHQIFKKDVDVKYISKSKIESLKVPSAEPPPPETTSPPEDQTANKSNTDITSVNDETIYVNAVQQPETPLACQYDEPVDNIDMLQDYDNDYFDNDEDVKPIISEDFVEVKPSCSTHEPTEFLPVQTYDTDITNTELDSRTKVIACDHCDYISQSKNKLAAHIRRTHDTKRYKCILCPFRTSQKKRLVNHRESHKKKSSVYKCNLCSYKTKFKIYILKHLSTIHNKVVKTKHVCVYCNASTISKAMLVAHRRRHRLPKSVQCTMCKFETIYKCQMKKHKRSHLCEQKDEKDENLTNPKATKMYTKEKVVNKQDSAESDNESAPDDGTFKCEKCQFRTRSEKKMSKHFIEEHNRCKYCSVDFPTRAELEIHLQNSKNQDVVKCFFCDFDSDYICETSRHMSSHFTGVYGLEEDCGANLEAKMAALIESVKFETKSEEMKNQETNLEEETDNTGRLQLHQNKFGNYLIDPNYIDPRTLKIKRASNNDSYQCPACDFSTKYNCSIQRHIQRNHANSRHRPYKCVDCNFVTKTKDQIRLHNERKLSRKILHCKRCKFTAKVKCALALHQKVHYNLKCVLCPQKFNYKRGLITHFATMHLKIGLRCQYCEFVASTKTALVEHESSHTGHKPFQCTVCEYTSSRERYLEIHFRKHNIFHKKMKKPYKKEILVRVKIEKVSQDNETYVCDICGFSDTDKGRLSAHIKRKHTMMFMCEKCPYTTPYKGALKTHSLTHQHYSIFKCKICPFETSFKGRIISHLRKIHNDKTMGEDSKLVCEFCGEKQRSAYMLRMHNENGKYDEPAKCKLCSFETLYKCHMEKHEKSHYDQDQNQPQTQEIKMYTEERVTDSALKCRFCNFIASKRSSITKHEATHTAENPFRCNLCRHSAKNNILLMAHWKKYHKQ